MDKIEIIDVWKIEGPYQDSFPITAKAFKTTTEVPALRKTAFCTKLYRY